MVAWAEYKNNARKRGSLAMELFVVISTPVKHLDVVKDVLPDHLAYQEEQEAAGTLALAGPLSDFSGEHMEGMGLIVYKAKSLSAAKEIAENDPMHLTKARTFTIRAWLLNEGFLAAS